MPETFSTSHRYLAAYLLAHSYSILHSNSEGGYVEFVFTNTPEMYDLIQGFYSNQGSVHPQDFIKGLDQVRVIIRGSRDKGERIDMGREA